MGAGSTSLATDYAGSPPSRLPIPAGTPIATGAAGFGPIQVGTGILIIPGAGLRFITDAGAPIRASAGFGFRTGSGVLPGSAGAIRMIIAGGLRSHRVAMP